MVAALLLLSGMYLLILASPGPNFFILSQLALSGRYREARHVVFGLVTGSLIWATLALAGVATLLAQHPWLASAVSLFGAAYLVWYGGRLLWSAIQMGSKSQSDATTGVDGTQTPQGAYRVGLLTGLTNPKGAAFWTSVFAVVSLPAQAPVWFYPLALLLITVLSLAWHLGIVFLFANRALRVAYLRAERAINGVAGGVLVGLGLHRMVAR